MNLLVDHNHTDGFLMSRLNYSVHEIGPALEISGTVIVADA